MFLLCFSLWINARRSQNELKDSLKHNIEKEIVMMKILNLSRLPIIVYFQKISYQLHLPPHIFCFFDFRIVSNLRFIIVSLINLK